MNLNNMIRKVFLYLNLLLLGCNSVTNSLFLEASLPDLDNYNNLVKTGDYAGGYKVGKWKYEADDKLFELYWGIYESDLIKINYPKSWKLKEVSGNLFYALSNNNNESFFSIKRKKISEISLYNFLKVKSFKISDLNIENLDNYILAKLEDSKRESYYLRTDVKTNNGDRVSYYLFYTEIDGFIYEFNFKVRGKSNKINKEVFAAIVFSFGGKNGKVFNERITNVEEIDIEALNKL